jgi:hypothetical protein
MKRYLSSNLIMDPCAISCATLSWLVIISQEMSMD